MRNLNSLPPSDVPYGLVRQNHDEGQTAIWHGIAPVAPFFLQFIVLVYAPYGMTLFRSRCNPAKKSDVRMNPTTWKLGKSVRQLTESLRLGQRRQHTELHLAHAAHSRFSMYFPGYISTCNWQAPMPVHPINASQCTPYSARSTPYSVVGQDAPDRTPIFLKLEVGMSVRHFLTERWASHTWNKMVCLTESLAYVRILRPHIEMLHL